MRKYFSWGLGSLLLAIVGLLGDISIVYFPLIGSIHSVGAQLLARALSLLIGYGPIIFSIISLIKEKGRERKLGIAGLILYFASLLFISIVVGAIRGH